MKLCFKIIKMINNFQGIYILCYICFGVLTFRFVYIFKFIVGGEVSVARIKFLSVSLAMLSQRPTVPRYLL